MKADGAEYSFNALFVSLKSANQLRIPLWMGVLNILHEIMHSFGARHDPEPTESADCTPKDKVHRTNLSQLVPFHKLYTIFGPI